MPALQRVEAEITAQALGEATSRHRVTPGENLSVIATQYRVTVDELLSANPRIEPDRIATGQWIEIPRRGSD